MELQKVENIADGYDCRFAMILPAYDPYKDAFDIFMDLFQKNWPDCPYPFVVANMHFECTFPDIKDFRHLPCGDEKRCRKRQEAAIQSVRAKYYIILEEDRMFTDPICTADIEAILDFMDEKDIHYFRMNPSFFPKKKEHRYSGYEHYYQIPAQEPYGMSGATSIYREDYLRDIFKTYSNEYLVENGFLQISNDAVDETIPNTATDDRNVLHVLHCIERSQWIPGAKAKLEKMGYSFDESTLKVQSLPTSVVSTVKFTIGKCIPIKARYHIKKFLSQLGMKFSTKY